MFSHASHLLMSFNALHVSTVRLLHLSVHACCEGKQPHNMTQVAAVCVAVKVDILTGIKCRHTYLPEEEGLQLHLVQLLVSICVCEVKLRV